MPLNLPYLVTPRSRPWSAATGWVTCQGNWLVWRSRPYSIYGKAMCFWKVKVGHLTTLSPSFYSSIWIWNLKRSHQICAGLFGIYILYKINSKSKWKNIWNPAEKHCLLWAQVRKFYLIVKVGYYPWISLACASIHTLVIHCLLSTVIHCW